MQLDRNNTDFPLELHKALKKVGEEWKLGSMLYYYQKVVHDYVVKLSKNRGILIKHVMGAGKTRLGAAILVSFITEYAPIFVSTRALRQNFRQTIIDYIIDTYTNDQSLLPQEIITVLLNITSPDGVRKTVESLVDKRISFISMNASNMYKQVVKAASSAGSEATKVLERNLESLSQVGTLERRLIIIDESQNFTRAVTNGSKNALSLYEMLMRTRDCKIVYLTGTPISNDVFETVPIFNTLSGKSILPEEYSEFYKLYTANGRIANKEKFQNRIFGLTSSITMYSRPGAGAGIDSKSIAGNFPMRLPLKVLKIPMTARQYAIYRLAKDKEDGESDGRGGRSAPPPTLTKPKSAIASTYRVRSRQLGNFAPDSDWDGKTVESPKFDKILEIANARTGQLGLVYSEFKGEGGLGALSMFLKSHGWKQYGYTGASESAADGPTAYSNRQPFGYDSWAPSTREFFEYYEKIGGVVDAMVDDAPVDNAPVDNAIAKPVVSDDLYSLDISHNGQLDYWNTRIGEPRLKIQLEYVADVDRGWFAKYFMDTASTADYLILKVNNHAIAVLRIMPGEPAKSMPFGERIVEMDLPQLVRLLRAYKVHHLPLMAARQPPKPVRGGADRAGADRVVYKSARAVIDALPDDVVVPNGYGISVRYADPEADADLIVELNKIYKRESRYVFLYTDAKFVGVLAVDSNVIDNLVFRISGPQLQAIILKQPWVSHADIDIQAPNGIYLGGIDTSDDIGDADLTVVDSSTSVTDLPQADDPKPHAVLYDRPRTFAIISGDVPTEMREDIKNTFNGNSNAHGGVIDLLLVTKTGAEGLDLRNGRWIVLLGSPWTGALVDQIISRFVRNNAHVMLQPEERVVEPFMLLAVPPEGEHNQSSTDVDMYERAIGGQQIIADFTMAIDETSIECLLNDEKTCRVCAPTNSMLFTGDPSADVRSADPCVPVREEKITAKIIVVDGIEYYYRADETSIYGYKIFRRDPKVDSYRQLSERDRSFEKIVEAITAVTNAPV